MIELKEIYLLQHFYMQAPMAVGIYLGKDHLVELANPKMLELWALKIEDVLNKPLFEALPTASGQGFEKIFRHVYETGISYKGEELPAAFDRKGVVETRFYTISVEPLRDAGDLIFGLMHTVMEVTEIVLSRKQLERNNEALKMALEAAKMGTWYCDLVQKKMIRSIEHDRVYGHKELLPEWSHDIFMSQVLSEDREFAMESFHKALAEGTFDYEVRVRWSDESIHWIKIKGETIYNLVRSPIAMSGIVMDVTEQKIALEKEKQFIAVHRFREEAERQKKLLTDVFSEAPALICTLRGPDHTFDLVNPLYQQLFPGRQLVGKPAFQAIPELEGQPFKDMLDQVYRTGETFSGNEIPMQIDPHGTGHLQTIYFNFIYQAIKNAGGEVNGILVFAFDVTELVLAKKQIEENERKLRTALQELETVAGESRKNENNLKIITDSLPAMVACGNREYKYLFANSPYLKFFNQENIIGKSGAEVVGESYFLSIKKHIDHVLEGNHLEYVTEVPLENGNRWLHAKYVPDFDGEGKVQGFVGLVQDITEERKANETLKMQARVLESMSEAVSISDENGIILYTNPAEERLFGYAPGEMCGKKVSIKNNLPEEERIQRMGAVMQELKTKGEWHGEFPNVRKDGSGFISSSNITALKIENKNYWVCIQQDITEQKAAADKLRESEERYRMLSEIIPQLIFISGPDGAIEHYNQNWVTYSGLSMDEVIGKSGRSIIHPLDSESVIMKWMAALKTGERFISEHRLRRYDGSYRWFLTHSLPVYDQEGNIHQWFGTATDIDDQKKAEEQLILINAEVNRKNDELQKTNNELDSFIYTASHDLKAPISNIEGLIEAIISDKSYEGLDIKPIIDMIGASVARFKKTILELTEISKTQKEAEEDIETVNLDEILEEVKFSIDDLVLKNQAKIIADFSPFPFLKFSRKNLRSILYNITSNAIKYRSPERTPEIFIHTLYSEGYVILTVKDNGLGIPGSQLGKVFQMFKRAHDHVDGTGIGLYIIKRLIDNAEGKIEVESIVGEGSTFKVYFKQ